MAPGLALDCVQALLKATEAFTSVMFVLCEPSPFKWTRTLPLSTDAFFISTHDETKETFSKLVSLYDPRDYGVNLWKNIETASNMVAEELMSHDHIILDWKQVLPVNVYNKKQRAVSVDLSGDFDAFIPDFLHLNPL